MSRFLFAIAWTGAVVATVAGLTGHPTVMGVSGLIAALAAIAWGFTVHRDPEGDGDGSCLVCDHPFGNQRHICIGGDPR